VTGKLPPEVVQRIVRRNFGRLRLCYENGLRRDPRLEGTVFVEFTIGADGSVSGVKSSGTLPDKAVVDCVDRAFVVLSFPQPEAGTVKVRYPIQFTPGEAVPLSIHGKALADATAADVEEELRRNGCIDIASRPDSVTHWTVFTVTRDLRKLTISFSPASAGILLTPAQIADFTARKAALRREDAFFIAIESDDEAASLALLDALIKPKAP